MKTRSFLLKMLLIATLCLTSLSPALAQVDEQNTTYTVILREVDNKERAFLAEQGISVDALTGERVVVTVTQAQLISLRDEGVEFEVLKSSDPDRLPSVTQSGYLSNEYLTISIIDTGQFTMWTADGRYLLYPNEGTGYLSVKVDSQVYNNDDGSLSVTTPFTVVDDNSAYIQYQTPESILVTQWFTLSDQAVQFKVEASNQDGTQHDVSVRYLFDTQVDINDGSPLYASTVGVRTYETDMPTLAFNSWRGYDIWPDPSLTSVGTFSTQPDRVVFAWWPNAVGYVWDYTPDPNQRFYTPGYTTSPESDSCVLAYFSMGTLASGTQDSITTYYGTEEPTADTDRERLISAFESFKEAVKSSITADLDAFSALQAKYVVSLRTDWRDYLGAAWTVASLAVPDPGDLAKLGKDAQLLSKASQIIGFVDLGRTVGLGLAGLLDGIPASISETQVKNDYIYPHFMNDVTFTPESGGTYVGISDYLEAIDDEYQFYVAQIPDPLPANYPVDFVISILEEQTAALYASSDQETYVLVIHENWCELAKLGVLQFQEDTMSDLAGKLEVAENVSFATMVTEIGAVLGGAGLKVAGVVGAPVTVGGSTVVLIPSEAILWGGVASITSISSVIGGISTVDGLSIQGAMTVASYDAIKQLPNDLALRRAVFQHTGNWVTTVTASGVEQLMQALTQSSVQIDSITIPDLVVSADETSGQGIGQVLISNAGDTPVNVNVYGSITTQLDQGMPTIGLVGSSSMSIAAGEQEPIEFMYTLLRSSLLHHTGYDAHLFVTVADSEEVSMQGPFVTHFFVGTDSQLAALDGQNFDTIDQGILGTGQVITRSVQFSPSTQSGRLLLSFAEGSDHDLHLYDASGNHVGVNYGTGEVENQIAGVSYSGSTTWPEWMIIDGPSSEAYQVRVVAQSSAAGKGYDLSKLETPLLPAILDAPASVIWSTVLTTKVSPTIESFGLQIAEGGGSQTISSLQISPTEFSGDGGTVIPASQISCEVPNEVVAGTSVLAKCSVTIFPEVPIGTYTGAIQVSGEDAGETTLTATTQVSLTLTEPRWSIYLPLVLR